MLLYGAEPLQTKAGLTSATDGLTDLQWAGPRCEDYSRQVWRWLTYQWSHVGAMHVLMNIFLNLFLGVPLEGLHGFWRMLLMYNVGVAGGAFCYYLMDAHTITVGCSGGCYSLMGIHLADLIMNWRQKKFRIPVVVTLLLLAGADVGSSLVSMAPENSSHSAHAGGFIAGLLIGVLVCRNVKMHCWERIFMLFDALIGFGLVGFACYFIFTAESGPVSFTEKQAGIPGYCWARQVYMPDVDENTWQCVRCGTPQCIAEWEKLGTANPDYISPVSYAWCEENGGWFYDGR